MRKIARKVISSLLKLAAFACMISVIFGGVFAYTQIEEIIAEAPDISNITLASEKAATYICDSNGNRTRKLTLPEANRDLVKLDEVPSDLQNAIVAIEDERFYEHNGIDLKGILRALYKGISTGSFSEGASTITQQLVKNIAFPDWTNETTFKERLVRKIQEQYLALKLELVMTKSQILEEYLNMINLGAGCYGVQAASYRYFGKSVSDLNLSECAVIAGITQNPTAYNPITNPQQNETRRRQVLGAMLEQGYIDQVSYDEALDDDVYERIKTNDTIVDTTSTVYTYYEDALIDQVMEDLQDELAYTYQQAYTAVYSGGLRIYSAQDSEIQDICDEEFENSSNFPAGTQVGIDYALSVQSSDKTVTDYGNDDLRTFVRNNGDSDFDLMFDTSEEAQTSADAFRKSVVKDGDTVLGERVTITPQPQASCVIIDQETGYVAALVGGRGEKEASLTLNRASYTTRQPGSAFKILTVYAPALQEKEVTLATTITDEPYNYEDGTPVNNASGTYQGEVTVREAILQSINVIAVKLITEITPEVGYKYAEKFGITTLTDELVTEYGTYTDVGQTLALGGISKGVTNLDLTGAYAAIANMGHYLAPKFYTKVTDSDGNILLDNTSPQSRTVISENTATVLTSAMRDVISNENGTAYGLIDLGVMPVAGKTGTTTSWKDSWFVGYTPYYTCGIWAGYDNNDSLPDTDLYHTYSKVLWNSIMNRISASQQITAFHTGSGVVKISICPVTHMVSAEGCAGAYEEVFIAGTQPQYYCDVHGTGALVAGSSVSEGTESSDSQSGNNISEETGGYSATDDMASRSDVITIYNSDQTIWRTDGGASTGTADADDSSLTDSGASTGTADADNSGLSGGGTSTGTADGSSSYSIYPEDSNISGVGTGNSSYDYTQGQTSGTSRQDSDQNVIEILG